MEEINKPDIPQSEITIPIKFNKEIKELTLQEATTLAQKGMKFEAIEKDYEALKGLAQRENKSVPAYINDLVSNHRDSCKRELTEKCGGNEEMANKILELENKDEKSPDFKEVFEAFPHIKSIEDLPQEVVERCSLKGTLPLDEYLRYLLSQNRAADAARKKQKETNSSTTGPLANLKGTDNSEAEEFLRGLWK